MYADEGVTKYYDHSILANYDTRYVLFILAVLCTGATAIVVPVILLIGMQRATGAPGMADSFSRGTGTPGAGRVRG